MTPSQITLLKEAAERGLELEAHGHDLHVIPGNRCPPDFAATLRDYKPRLIALLRLPFRMEYSRILKETLFFAQDEATRAALVEAGAEPWSIYTRDELRILVAQNRAKPFLPDELCKVHEIKGAFHGRITK